jgi:hypothetical protein
MVKKAVKKPASRDTVTIGAIIAHVKLIEEQCRILRMLLQRLDRTTEVTLTPQLKRTLKAQAALIPPGIAC